MKNSCFSRIGVLFFLFGLTSIVFGQSKDYEYEIGKIKGTIIFDGKPDEEAWSEIEPFPFIMYQPNNGQKPSEETDVRIGFDDRFLYLGACLYYEDVSIIQALGKKRDYSNPTCDWLGLHLDTYNDNQNALVFYTNPNGIRSDASVKNNIKTFDRDVNFDWNTYWEVKTIIDSLGWYAEFKIPLSSLRFQTIDGNTVMGLTLNRFIPGKNEWDIFPDIPPEYNMGTWKPYLSQDVLFRGLSSRKPLYFSPYVLAGVTRENILNEAETEYLIENSPTVDAGLDVKIGLTNNLTVDVTLNTDFAQVEADDQQINLTRYSLFFPEKRVFFQEKSDAFDFSMGGNSNLFYSRRIGLYEDQPVRIYGGARLTGRAGKWDIGLLDMQTQKITELPSENFGVARFRRTVFNQYSYLGGMFTSRIALNGDYNLAGGIDGNIRLFGDDYFSFHYARTLDNEITDSEYSLDPVRMMFVIDRRSEEGFAYDVTFTWSGKDFNPEMGFTRRDDYVGGYLMGLYGWVPGESSVLVRHKFKTELMNYYKTHSGGLLETFWIRSGWYYESKSGWSGDITHNYSYEFLSDSLEFCDNASICPGTYKFHYLSSSINIPPTSPVVGMIMSEAGQFYDGLRISTTLMPIWSIGPSFDLSGTYRIDWIKFPERSTSFINHIIGVRGLWTLSTKTSFSAFIQYNTDVDDVITNIRFRYNPREGVDFYLVYNEGLNTDPYSRVPELPLSDNRTLMAKFTYTFGR